MENLWKFSIKKKIFFVNLFDCKKNNFFEVNEPLNRVLRVQYLVK